MRRLLIALCILLFGSTAASAQHTTFNIAVHASLTGSAAFGGAAYLQAVRFAVDEANAAATGPRFELTVYDDASTEAGARTVASRIIASDAALVLGPTLSALAIAVCPLYGQAGVPTIISTVHADELTDNPTTFRTVISTGEIGEALADYYGRVLHGRQFTVLSKGNGYGRPLAARFSRAAARLGLQGSYRTFANAAERDTVAREIGAVRDQATVVLGMSFEDAVPALINLRRQGFRGLVMGTATMARASFNDLFASQPEAQHDPGFFTNDAYATSPMILDSANAEILAFAGRYQARFGQSPSWETVQAYDGALLAMAALGDAAGRDGELARASPRSRRDAALGAIASFDRPTRAVAGLNGPIWFTPDRIRRQPVRIGRFRDGLFESAPLQLVPVSTPDPAEVASGEVFRTEPGHFYRLQRVVHTGTFLNLLPRVDIAKSSFGADFYLWLRYARDAGPGAADPVDIGFPDMVSGHFDPATPAEATLMADGTEYRLWRIQGDFRADFDLHRFPFDRQELQIRFFNTRASSNRIVYVLDRRSPGSGAGVSAPIAGPPASGIGSVANAATSNAAAETSGAKTLASPNAFAELSQWRPTSAEERRDTLVTPSALGDLRRIGLQTPRELSGFSVMFGLERRTTAVLIKSLLPMLLMTVVIYCTLHFPHALTKEKVTVAVTAALSGAVLLSAVNNQLGSVGYTIAAEYAFYAFFALGLLCVLYVMVFETLRLAGHSAVANRVEHATRVIFLAAVLATVGLAWAIYAHA